MRIELPEKWIEHAAADDWVGQVAVETLRNRLQTVFQLLPLAAERAEEDVEYIHQLRVWTRRATTALTLYEQLMPRRIFSWMKRQLKRIRKAANYARDCDILLARLGDNEELSEVKQRLRELRAERELAQLTVVAMNERLNRDDRAAGRIEKLLKSVQSKGEKSFATATFGEWARNRLQPFVTKFFQAVPVDQTDIPAMHQFRIRGKKLRYAMELLTGAFPPNFRDELYPMVEAMQDHLGEINDLAMAKVRFQQSLELLSADEAAAWRILMECEQARFTEILQKFWEWCTPERLRQLQNGFSALLADFDKSQTTEGLELLPAVLE